MRCCWKRTETGARPMGRITDNPAKIIARRRARLWDRQAWGSLLARVLLFGGAVWVLLTQVFLVTQVRGNDMFPALKDGDLVIAFRLQQRYSQNDVVVYTAGGETRLGRVAAAGGDAVDLGDTGMLLVNGTNQAGEILYPTYAKEALSYPYAVPEGTVFLLADHRTQGEDSRDVGPVPVENLSGKVITILRRRDV